MELQFDEQGVPFVMWGGHKLNLETEPLSDKMLVEKAEKELRETPEVVEQALKEFRQLLKNEPSLFIPIDNDEFLLKFLRPCKFYVESALKRMKAYYKFRQSHTEYCHNLMPSAVKAPFNHSVVSILSPRDQYGRRIMIIEAGQNWNPREVPLQEVFRGIQMGLEGAMKEPQTQICGVVSIFEMKGLSFSQVMQFTPFYAKMILEWIQFCVPIRVKAVHIVNQPYIFNMLFAIFKPFIQDKLRKRIHFHGSDMSSLLAHIEPRALRKRHGGLLPEPEVPGDVLWKMLSHYEDNFKLANSFGYTTKK